MQREAPNNWIDRSAQADFVSFPQC